MIVTSASHLDHGLPRKIVNYLKDRFALRAEFFLETIELPDELPSVPCGLHGPILGDAPVPDDECSMRVRGTRSGPSRVCRRPLRPSRRVSIIAGPHEGHPCVLYTAFGGPVAPKEPWEFPPGSDERKVSVAFWAQHALSIGGE